MAGRGLDAGLTATVQELWERARPVALERLNVLDDAVAAVMVGALDDELRDRAMRESHKLAGSLGTFGLRDATERAAALETAFAQPPATEQAPQLAEHAVELRRLVEAGEAGSAAVSLDREPDVVAVGLPVADAVALVSAGEERGLAVAAVGEPEAAGDGAPVVLLSGEVPDLPELVERLASGGTTIALALAPDSPHDRVELVRRGARRLLPPDASPDALMDALAELTESRRPPAGRVLVIDDDPTILLVMEAILGGAGYEVTILEDPLAVWAALERTKPDLMVCDVSMPGLDGIDLCRTLRADSRWQHLPLLFLTAHSTPEVVSELFAAGADDYVNKPVLGPELLARVRSRLERQALQRAIEDVDRLTGLLRRDTARPQFDGLLKLGRRLGQPVCLAAFGVDELSRINRELGHAAGDAALAAAGQALRAAFASDGVAARWGGGELVVGMVGLGVHDARDRVGAVLEEIRQASVPAAGGHVTVSAGLATWPADGEEVDDLVAAAIDAARIAAADGGDRLSTPEASAAVDQVDVALVEDDDILAPLLLHALQTRGYSVRRIPDGDEAARLLGGPRPELRAELVLLDWDLPGRDGLTVLRGLAEDGGLVATQVVMLTFRASEREVISSLELGAVDHIAKPFSVPVLMQRVRRLLGQ
ncbi:MAG TPA: response regulator [Solirubrobacteraceae bacterium]|nr:response regulator [Solirubrobacteraceae bacterium]